MNYPKLIVAMVAWLTVGTATAQTNVKKAMDDLLNSKSAVRVLTSNYEHDMGGEAETYCHYTVLQFDRKQAAKMIARVEKAFDQDARTAFYTMLQTPKIQAEGRISVTYGPSLEYGVTFGTKKDHYYRVICTEDPANAAKRHAYAMVWYYEGSGVRCLLYHIYGQRPDKKAGLRLTSLQDYLSAGNGSSRWAGGTAVVDDSMVRMVTANGSSIVTADAGIGKVADDADFLLLFGNLRVAFLDAIKDSDKKVLQTGIAMKLMKLCKAHATLLSDREKTTCRASLAEMRKALQKTQPDTFIDGILVEADQALH